MTCKPAPASRALEQWLDANVTPAQLALLRLIGHIGAAKDYSVYIVGGFVRDLLRADPQSHALDLDIVVEADAIAFAQQLAQRYGGRVIAHQRFGTATWLLQDPAWPVRWEKLFDAFPPPFPVENRGLPQTIDFVTARTEFYTAPAVLPTVEFSNIKLDLHRRDFTINTLAICLNPERWGELLDFYGGAQDIEQGTVRVLHSLSFVDDPTRILRAVRYEQRFAFQIDPRTLELLRDALELLDHLTPTRLRHELERIFHEAQPEKAFARLHGLGLLVRIQPDFHVNDWLQDSFARLRQIRADPQGDPTLRQASLVRLYWAVIACVLPAAGQLALSERLQLDKETQRSMTAMQQLQQQAATLRDPQLRPSQAVTILDEIDFSAQALYHALAIDPTLVSVLQHYATHWRTVRPFLTGDDLRALGLPPGPRYSQILAQLRAARLDGEIATRAQEVAIIRAG